jgi:hypothetical protein
MSGPKPGDTRHKVGCSLRVRCNNTGSDSGAAAYHPEEGWGLVNWQYIEHSKFGIASKSISYVAANSEVVVETSIQSKYKDAIEGAYQKGLVTYGGKLKIERDRMLDARHKIGSSHRGIVAEAHCSGEGIFGGGSSLDFTIEVDEIFVGTPAYLDQVIQEHEDYIEQQQGGGGNGGGGDTSTRIRLLDLHCVTTEDNFGSDECELRVRADSNAFTLRSDLSNGQHWNLNLPLEFTQKVSVRLLDLDDPGFPIFDDHDDLGSIEINPGQTSGSGTFNKDGADYVLTWGPG